MTDIDHKAYEASLRNAPDDYICTNGHDRCESGGFEGCPYCIAPLNLAQEAYLQLADERQSLLDRVKELEGERDRLHEIINKAPIASKYHGAHGFETEEFLDAYANWKRGIHRLRP
jgi:hypothetical protein